MTPEQLQAIEEIGYDAYFIRGESSAENPYEDDAADAWEKGRSRAEADCE